jgi:hypothetical protein
MGETPKPPAQPVVIRTRAELDARLAAGRGLRGETVEDLDLTGLAAEKLDLTGATLRRVRLRGARLAGSTCRARASSRSISATRPRWSERAEGPSPSCPRSRAGLT